MEAIGRLAGGIAHDFNNLLTIIIGNSELLGESIDPQDPKSQLIQQIHKAGERGAGLTRQLLAFSRKQVLAPKVLDLNALVADLDEMLRRLIGEDIDLVPIQAPDLHRVQADPGQLEQVLMNLVVNARDAMPHGGKLTLETRNVDLEEGQFPGHPAVRPGPYAMVAVTDTGCGMDEHTKAHLFEPFFTTKEPGKGTGLGLATVYGIIKQSDGHITVESEPGRGTTFHVYLPAVNTKATARPSNLGHLQTRQGKETILLVEDDDAVRALARQILERSGYTVLEASNGNEALQVCEANSKIHLMVTDVVMPQISGRQLADLLLPLRPNMKVCYMTGYTDDMIIHHRVLGAGTAFLQKPFTAALLTHKVREVLDQPA
jgi:two-component system cell cycle sensor histidine kinase/response regulator CckA